MNTSKIVDCDLITRPGENIFETSGIDDGALYVNLENYLLVPKEVLTAEEIAAIWKKSEARRTSEQPV